MSPFRPFLPAVLISLLAVSAVSGETPENLPLRGTDFPVESIVTVHLSTGRIASGIIDERTDGRRLWLRGDTTQAQVCSGLLWSEVASISPGRRPGTIRITNEFRSPALLDTVPCPAAIAIDGYGPKRNVTSLHIESAIANWDRDAAIDGLRVRIIPLDRDQEVIPTTGSISFELIGQYRPSSGGRVVRRMNAFPTLERWTVSISREDYDQQGATVELPFRQFHPQQDVDIAADGLLFARFSVAGQGVYEATDDWLLLRPPNRIRDDHQLWNGMRQFPVERNP